MEDLLFWLIVGGPALAPFVIAVIGEIWNSLKAQSHQVSTQANRVEVHAPMRKQRHGGAVSTPSQSECFEAVRLLMHDLDEGISYLSKYYDVPVPFISINEALLEARGAEGLCSGDTIYLKSKPRIFTVLHEFFHYLVGCKGHIYDDEIEEMRANTFAREVLEKAATYLKYSATLEVDYWDVIDKEFKRWRERLRKSLERVFPENEEIVEELLNRIVPDLDEEEDDD